MRRTDFNKLKKKKTPHQILNMHCNYLVYLTKKQVNELIEKR